MSPKRKFRTSATNPKLNIFVLITQMERAGAQKIAIMQAHHFHQQGHQVTLGFFYDKYALIPDLRQQYSFPILDFQAKPKIGDKFGIFYRTGRAIWHLFWYLKKQRVDAIITFTTYSNFIGIVTAWLAGVPIRVSSQRNPLDDFPQWFQRLDAALVNSPLTDYMIAVSEQTRAYCLQVEGMNPEKVLTINNGISPAAFQAFVQNPAERAATRAEFNIALDVPVLITVARLHPQKGHEYLITASKEILQKYPDTVFVFVGDGPDREKIQQRISCSNHSNNFRLLGSRADIPRLLGMSDIFVLPSRYEGMPNVLLEAMAAQLPVVATQVDGTTEIVINGKTGLLVPPEDANALANAICQLLSNPAQCSSFAQQGFQHISEHFSEEVMCQQYESLLLCLSEGKLIDETRSLS